MRRRFMPIACAVAILAGGLLASATAPTTGLMPAAAKASVDKPQWTKDEITTTPVTTQTVPTTPTTATTPTTLTTPTTPTTPTTATTPTSGRAESLTDVAGVTAGLPAQPDAVTVGGSGSTLSDALDDAQARAKTIAKHEHITLGDVQAVSSPKPPTGACGQVYDGPDISCSNETVIVSYEIVQADDVSPGDAP